MRDGTANAVGQQQTQPSPRAGTAPGISHLYNKRACRPQTPFRMQKYSSSPACLHIHAPLPPCPRSCSPAPGGGAPLRAPPPWIRQIHRIPPRFHKNPVHRPVFLRKGVKSMVNLFKAVRLALQTLCKTRKLSSGHKIALTKYNYTGILIHSSIKQGTAYFFNAAALCPAGAPPR